MQAFIKAVKTGNKIYQRPEQQCNIPIAFANRS